MHSIKKQLLVFCLFFILVFGFQACTSNNSTEVTDSTSIEKGDTITDVIAPSSMSNDLPSLILNSNKGERAQSIGKKLTEALAAETLEPSDSASNFYSFTQYFNNSNDEFVDIQYYHNGEIVKGLNLDIYLNNEADVSLLFEQLAGIFSKKHGKSSKTMRENSWKLKNGLDLVLKDVSVKLAPGLQVRYSKKGDNLDIE